MAATLAMPTSVPVRRARMAVTKGWKVAARPRLLVSKVRAHHLEVAEHRGVHADADAGVGDHHVGQALRGDAGAAGGGDAVDVAHVGGVDGAACRIQALRLRPGLDLAGAPRHQRQPVAGAVEAPGQRLADAAGGAGDEDQRRHWSSAVWRLAAGSCAAHAPAELDQAVEVVVLHAVGAQLRCRRASPSPAGASARARCRGRHAGTRRGT